MNTKAREQKAPNALVQTRNLAKASLIAVACMLAGVGSALAGLVTVTAATGGEAIRATTANGAWTTLTGPVLTECAHGSIGGNGTIVLTVPAGFEFNPASTVTVLVEGGTGPNNINGVPNGGTIPVTVTRTTLTFAVTSKSGASPSVGTTLTYQNIQVRPTVPTPLASGNLTESGTCGLKDLTLASGTWGFLREVGGAPTGYRITGGSGGTAGSPISITLQKIDQFGNPVNDSTPETLTFSGVGTIGANAPTINGSTGGFTTGITVTFDGSGSATVTLIDYLAGPATLNVTDGTSSGGPGLSITVVPGPAAALVFAAAPATITYGSTFGVQVQSTDLYGNPSTTGLNSSVDVTLTLTSGTRSLAGALTQDLGTGAGNGSATFTGLQITAAGNGDVLSAGASGCTAGTTTLSVLPLVITPSVVVGSKTYDGTTVASILSSSLAGVIGGDNVSLGQSGTAVFANKHVGPAKPVTISGLSLTGSAAGNYRLSTASLSAAADITSRSLVVAATPQDRKYDGTALSTVPPAISSGSLAGGDTCALSQHFADKWAGNGKLIIPSGSINDGNSGNNYSVSFANNLDGMISAKAVTVTGITANDKVYDGTQTATLNTAGAALVGLVPLDAVNLVTTGATGAFIDPNVGPGKTVQVSGLTLSGGDAGNYTLAQPDTTANITQAGLTVSGIEAQSKVYDGTNSAALIVSNAVLVGVLSGDTGDVEHDERRGRVCGQECRNRQTGDGERPDPPG